MKIFIAHEDPWNAGNPYIFTLIESIQKSHPDVRFGWGWKSFWDEDIWEYDAVHFQWPQAYMSQAPKEKAYDMLKNRLKELRRHNIKILSTCHDLEPHYNQCSDYGKCMTLVYDNSDAIFHLGEYSLAIFSQRYPDGKHLLLPHHVYDNLYKNRYSRLESVQHLNMPQNKVYVLCFGSFRSDSERQLVVNVSKKLNDDSVIFLAPSFMRVTKYSNKLLRNIPTRSKLRQLYYKWKYNILMSGEEWAPIDDSELPYYYGIADVAFIQRPKILNSGNAVLPFLFNVAIVGPQVGNVEGLLNEYKYPTFDPENIQSVVDALKKGFELAKENYPSKIQEKALSKMSTDAIAGKLYSYYSDLLNCR